MANRPITDFAQNILKPYINNQDKAYAANIAPVETSPATSAHTAGTQIIYNGVLYDVTADIAANDVLATTGAGANIAAADDVSEQISNVKQALSNEVSARATLGAHNLLYTDLQTLKGHPQNLSGNWSGTSMTKNGLTWTVNDDFSVTVNGAVNNNNTQGFFFALSDELMNFVKGKTIKVSGCPSNGGTGKYRLMIQRENGTLEGYSDTGNGVTYTVPSDEPQLRIALLCYPAYGTYTNLVFKPMLCLEEEEKWHYEDFVPASKTNVELTRDDAGLTANAFANGAVNLLPNTATSQTIRKAVFQVQSDGKVTVSTAGQAVETGGATLVVNTMINIDPTKRYKLSGCPKTSNDVDLVAGIHNGDTWVRNVIDTGDGIEFVAGYSKLSISIVIHSGEVVSSLEFRPMLTLADVPNSDYNHYVPYAMTNKELTDNKANVSDMVFAKVTGDTNNSGVVIPSGLIFSLNGELVKAKTAIAVNATLTLNTNYEKFATGALNGLSLFVPTDIGTTALKTYADSYAGGGRIEWVSYGASNADAPSAYAGYAQIISMTSNFRTIIAYSRDGNMYQLCKSTTWGTWKTITMA